MKHRTRLYFSAEQRADIWDRWQRGESMSSIGRLELSYELNESFALTSLFAPFPCKPFEGSSSESFGCLTKAF